MDIYIYIYPLTMLISYTKPQYHYQNQIPSYDHYGVDRMDSIYDYYEDSAECTCACQVCVDVRPCCRDICTNCFQQQQSIVIVPYPYPFIISTIEKGRITVASQTTESLSTEKTTTIPTTEPTETQATTVSIPEETTTLPTDVLRNAYLNDVIGKSRMNDRNKFVLTSLRRTKTNWMPKYGIVPIPDNLAEKLMLQLRSMRVLHPHKEMFKPKDILNQSLEKA